MLNFIGTGSAFSQEINSCAYIISEKKLILFDCGENTFSKIKTILDDNDLDDVNIFISHTHADHVNGLSTLIFYCYYVKKIPVHIYTGSLTIEKNIHRLLEINDNTSEQYRIYHITTDLVKITNEVIISFCKTYHVDTLDCYGFLINYKDKNIYYSGDSLIIPDVIYQLMCDNTVDILYQDIGLHYDGRVHMSLEDLKVYDFSNYNGKIYLYHNNAQGLIEFK